MTFQISSAQINGSGLQAGESVHNMNGSELFQNVRKETIYIELLNEGTSVWRPAPALRIGPHTYVVLPTPDYDPENEEWKFPPGSIVVGQMQTLSGEDVLVASAQADIRQAP